MRITSYPLAPSVLDDDYLLIDSDENGTRRFPVSDFQPDVDANSIISQIPSANTSAAGLTKLYTTTGQNTDGAIDQKGVTEKLQTATASQPGLTKLYSSTGTATDGTMTQSAISSAIGNPLKYIGLKNKSTPITFTASSTSGYLGYFDVSTVNTVPDTVRAFIFSSHLQFNFGNSLSSTLEGAGTGVAAPLTSAPSTTNGLTYTGNGTLLASAVHVAGSTSAAIVARSLMMGGFQRMSDSLVRIYCNPLNASYILSTNTSTSTFSLTSRLSNILTTVDKLYIWLACIYE